MVETHVDVERLRHRSKLMDLAEDILLVIDTTGIIHDINEAGAKLHGLTVDELIGRNCSEFLHPQSVKDMLDMGVDMVMRNVDGTARLDVRAFNAKGETVHLELRVGYSVEGERFYCVERDTTERHARDTKLAQLSEELRKQALTDSLTGIANRAAFEAAAQEIMESDADACLLILDIDKFKVINDSYGHVVGDDVLRHLSEKVGFAVRPDDLFARIGGDEFAIITRRPETAQVLAFEVSSALNTEFEVEGAPLALSVSLGLARREPGESTIAWLRRADRKMYNQKELRRERLRLAS